ARAEGRLPLGVGVRAHREAELEKKTLIASEQDRPDVARRRAQWQVRQTRIDPARLVFIDETLGSSPRAGSGSRPTWRRCGAGRRAASGSKPRCRIAAGRP